MIGTEEYNDIFIEEVTNCVQNPSNTSTIQISDHEAKLLNLANTCIQNDVTLNVCSGLTTYEVNIIKECDDIYLRDALILNRKKKYALLKILNRLKTHQNNLQNQKTQCKSISVADSDWNKRISTFRLGMPYFKDSKMYSSPHNDDYYTMQNNKELVQQSYCVPRPWSQIDKFKLALAVYKIICFEKENELKKQIQNLRNEDQHPTNTTPDILLEEINYLSNKELIYNIATKWNIVSILNNEEIIEAKNDLRENITYLQSQIVASNNAIYKKDLLEKVKKLEQEFNDINSKNYIISLVSMWDKKIDWLSISCNEVQRHTDIECKFMWYSYMNPCNSKKPWTEDQNKHLVEAVKTYNMQNWEAISEVIDLKKSAYQCCIHFFSKLWDKYLKTKWTKEENIYLNNLINMFQIGNFIPWSKIAKYFTERSKQQIYKHYVTCMKVENVKKGVYTLAEDILLCALYKHYNSFTKTSYYFPNRNISQLRDRYNYMRYNFRDWTFEDDIKILKHVEKNGETNWKIPNLDRNPSSIRSRYNLLKKWIVEHPAQSIQSIQRRKKSSNSQNKYLEKKNILDKIVDQLLEKISEAETPETVFNMKYIENLLSQIGYNQKEKRVVRRTGRKRLSEQNLSYFMSEFFKYYYNFNGRQKTWVDFDCVKGAERIETILNILGAKLNIPDVNTLEEHNLLDELDVKLLKQLSNKHRNNFEPSPSTSTSTLETVNTLQECSNALPPDPVTLIGFRGVMLHLPQLKNNATNYYHSINRYLPTVSQYVINHTGIKNTAELMLRQIEDLDRNEIDTILQERLLFEKRLKSLFKWPAIMSLPDNAPPENIFSNTEKQVEIKAPVRKVGRPLKVSAKVQRMLEGKKRKKIMQNEEIKVEKRQKVDDDN